MRIPKQSSRIPNRRLVAGGRPSTWSPPGRLVEHHNQRPTNNSPTTDRRPTDDQGTTDQQLTDDRPTIARRPTDKRPIHDVRPSTTFQTMLNHSRNILNLFTFAFNSFKKLSNFLHFLTSRTSNFARVEPHLKVYRGANPLACASSLTFLRHKNSPK